MTKAQNTEQLADGIYHLYSPSESDPVLVHLYDNRDEQCRGFGFNTHDGGGFLPLAHLATDSKIVSVKITDLEDSSHAASPTT